MQRARSALACPRAYSHGPRRVYDRRARVGRATRRRHGPHRGPAHAHLTGIATNLHEASAMAIQLPIYLDYHSTTPVDPRVVADILPYFTVHFGNAASRNHPFAWSAEEAVEKARKQV